jgi:hypothetical protein
MRARFQRSARERTTKGPVHARTARLKRGRPPRSRIYLCQFDAQLLCGHSQKRVAVLLGTCDWIQTNFILPVKALNFFFKFEDEYRAFARPEGRAIAFGGYYTFRIPKLQAPPSGPEAPSTP